MARALLVPLRSNARSLVSGAPVAALRRRIKFASIVFDEVLLEGGRIIISVGPTASTSLTIPNEDHPRFQTPRARQIKPGDRLTLAIGMEETPGTLAPVMHAALDSEITYSWDATLRPFEAEFPVGCDWIRWVVPSLDSEHKQLARDWSRTDERSPSVRRAWPETIVRSCLVGNANHDLVMAAGAGVAVTQDPLHRRVLESRYDTGSGWSPTAFLLPIVVPQVGELDWESIAQLRRSRGLTYFRAVMGEIEGKVLEEAAVGDVEAAAHHAFEAYLAAASSDRMTFGGFARSGLANLAVGGVVGAVTASWAGPTGFAAATALGAGASSVQDVVKMTRRSRRSWITAYQAILRSQ